MNERTRRYAFEVLGLTLLISALRNWMITVRELQRFYTNFPIWDAFEWVSHFSRYQQFDWSVLWVQHNEHREIGTELLFATDMLLFHGRQILPTVVGIAAYLGVLGLFAAVAWRQSEDRWLAGCMALMIAAFAGYKLCVVSLTIPFLTSWPQWEFFGTAALAALSLHRRSGGKAMLVLSIACAGVATYSMSNGMLVWPLLFAAALLRRFSKWEVLAIVVSGAVAICAYFYHYRVLHTMTVGTAVNHPAYLAGFIGNFLGMPFSAVSGFSHPVLASCFGWLGLSVAAADVVFIVRKRLAAAPMVIVAGGFCLLAIGSTLITAAARMEPADPYFQSARAGRYITEPTLFWCALVVLTAWLLRQAWRGFGGLLFLAAFGMMAALTLPRTAGYYSWWERYFQRGEWAEIAAANGVVDGEVADVLMPSREFVVRMMPILVKNKLAVFADAEPGWIGRRLTELFKRGPDGYFPGEVTSVRRTGNGYEVQGWADKAATFVFADETGKIMGFGMRPKVGAAEIYTHDVPRALAFTGFIKGDSGARAFSLWSVDSAKKFAARMGQRRIELPQ